MLLADCAPPKRPPYTSWQNHDPTCCTLVHHHRSMTRRSEESVATKRDCGKGTAPHNIWPTGAIRKHLLFSFLGGNTTSLREDWWHSRLKVGDLSLPFKLGTSLTSISHPKLMWRDSKAKKQFFLQNISRKLLQTLGQELAVYFVCVVPPLSQET